MRIFYTLLLIFTITIGAAQTIPATCEDCVVADFFSTSQFIDVQPTDDFYAELLELTDRLGIHVAPCNPKTFGSRQTLTTAMVIPMLQTAMQRMQEMMLTVTGNLGEEAAKKVRKQLAPAAFDRHKHGFTTTEQVKDLSVLDCYFPQVQSLLEDYHIDMTNKQGLLEATKPANGRDMAELLQKVFGLTRFTPTDYTNEQVTKGIFVKMLGSALKEYMEILNASIQ